MSTIAAIDIYFKANSGMVSCEFGKGIAILDLRSNVYYSLNTVGAFVWDLIQAPRTISELCDAVVAAFDVEPGKCRRDISILLDELGRKNLVVCANETPA